MAHEPTFCEDCHRDQEPRDHTALFRTRTHGIVASIDRARCETCHQPDFCIRCHSEVSPRSHRGMWARGRNTHCIACHIPVASEPRCYTCHKSAPHETAQAVINSAGYTAAFRKRIGYSMGAAFAPDWGEGAILSLFSGVDRLLEPGMVFHLPATLRSFGEFTVGASETVIVTETGVDVLSDLPREMTVR